jgi:hypothetical protein
VTRPQHVIAASVYRAESYDDEDMNRIRGEACPKREAVRHAMISGGAPSFLRETGTARGRRLFVPVRRSPTRIVLSEADGLPNTCAANLDNLQTVLKSNIGARIARLSSRKMKEAAAATSFALALDEAESKRAGKGLKLSWSRS